MKKLITIMLIAAMTIMCGCKSVEQNCKDGPVAPESYSSEKSDAGDPQLPNPHVWWN